MALKDCIYVAAQLNPLEHKEHEGRGVDVNPGVDLPMRLSMHK